MQPVNQIPEFPSLFEESLVTLAEAIKLFPIAISRPTLERYIRKGLRNVKLRTVYFAGRRLTSTAEISRFLAATQNVGEPPHAAEPTPALSQKELDVARQKYNLPVSGKNGIAADKGTK